MVPSNIMVSERPQGGEGGVELTEKPDSGSPKMDGQLEKKGDQLEK